MSSYKYIDITRNLFVVRYFDRINVLLYVIIVSKVVQFHGDENCTQIQQQMKRIGMEKGKSYEIVCNMVFK